MSAQKTLSLNMGGVKMPTLGFGTWQAEPGEVEKAVAKALKVGYRHIDCAFEYGNQDEVGKGIDMSGIARDKMHLTSKLWNTSHNTKDVEPELDQTLKQLGTDYLDLYLMHWPIPFKPGKEIKPMADDGKVAIDWDGPSHAVTWKEMVRIQKETKKARAVGVCNHTVEQLERIIKDSGVTPAVNQIEGHPTLLQPELFKFCKDKGIAITCYSPLGHNITGKTRAIDESKVNEIAQKLGKDAGQVLIAWALKSGFSVIPKSVTPERIESNFETFELPDKEFDELNEFGKKNRTRGNVPAEFDPVWPINVFNEESEQQYKKVW